MKFRKITGIVLSLALTGVMFFSQMAVLPAEAAPHSTITVENSTSLKDVVVQTPKNSVKAFALMNWAEEAAEFRVVLRLNKSDCGPNAVKLFKDNASNLGATLFDIYDPELIRQLDGCVRSTVLAAEPIQISMAAPTDSADLDWAIISYDADGKITVLPDVDTSSSTITFTARNFHLWGLVSAPKGSFKSYKAIGLSKLCAKMEKGLANYPKHGSVYSSVGTDCVSTPLADIGIVSAQSYVCNAMGITDAERGRGIYPVLNFYQSTAGPSARKSMEAAVKTSKGQDAIYLDVELAKEGNGHTPVTAVSAPITVTLSVPGSFPMYADYAVVVLNADGSSSIHKDIDTDASTISFVTSDFRMIALVHGDPGSFDSFK